MANQVEIFNIEFGDTLASINKLKAELKETRKLFNDAKPNTAEFQKYSAEVKRLDSGIKLLNNTTKDQVNALGGINKSTKFAEGSYGELKQKIDDQRKALNNLNTESEEFNATLQGLNKLQEQRIAIEKKIPSLFQERITAAIDESNALKQLRTDLKAAQSAALNGDGEAAKKVAELKDKIDDLKDSTKSLQGSGVERLNTSVGLLTQGFQDFDADKVKTGFKGIGAAMSAIPIILIIEGIKALIENFDEVVKFSKAFTDTFSDSERAVKKLTATTEAETVVNKNLISQYSNEIELLEAKGGQEKKLTELKKKKLEVEILELENQVRLRFAKVNEVLLNDDISESLDKVVIATARKLGFDEKADALEASLSKDKKERYKEDLEAGREAARQIGEARTAIAVLDIEYNKKQVEAAKEKNKTIAELEKDRQAREADVENALIDKEEQRVKDSLNRQKQAANMSVDIEKQLIANIEALEIQRLDDKIALAETNLINARREGENYLEAQLELLYAQRDQELENTELTEAKKAEIKARYADEEFRLTVENDSRNLQAAGSLSSALGDMSNSLFDLRRSNLQKGSEEDRAAAEKQFNSNKLFSIGTALISGAVAVVNASASVPYLPVGLAASIGASATTIATVAKIASQKFQYFKGGYTSKGNPTHEAESIGNAQFHNNEYVVPDKVLSTPQAQPHVSALERMRKGNTNIPGFFDGGFTARSISKGAESAAGLQSSIVNIIKSMPTPILKVSDLLKVQASMEQSVIVGDL